LEYRGVTVGDIPEYWRRLTMGCVNDFLNKAKWHLEEVEKLKKKLGEHAEFLGVTIDFNKWKIVEENTGEEQKT